MAGRYRKVEGAKVWVTTPGRLRWNTIRQNTRTSRYR